MKAEIICVGTEILMGNIVNTNAAYISRGLAGLGVSCFYQSVVGDNDGRLSEVFDEAAKRADIVILSGGLGPTEDDLTKETVAKAMGRKLVEDEKAWKQIKKFFEKRDIKYTDNNRKQALVPEGAKVLYNKNGTAPGIIAEGENVTAILLPGPPGELIPMWDDQVVPYIREKSDTVFVSEMVKLCGVGESLVETELKDLIDAQTNPTIATYAKVGEVDIRVTASAPDEKAAGKLVKPVVKEIKKRFGSYIFTTDENVTLEAAVLQLLDENKLTLATAESLTGGMLTSRLINVPGASEVIKTGFITYSNKSKRKYLGVKRSTLEKHGAVSEQCAKEMVKGCAAATKADAAISLTGIAGPDGGSEEKPVGLTYIGVSVLGSIKVKKFVFSGEREKIRESATATALTMLRHSLLESLTER
ncbi:MAG TPA: competence/damage-inducible protein A, partial [Lachnospiraceae bacterium]|nr:competence/damage-inducible protein A [Lachnospiraceae bacterium]